MKRMEACYPEPMTMRAIMKDRRGQEGQKKAKGKKMDGKSIATPWYARQSDNIR
jgi:hypothetical protein